MKKVLFSDVLYSPKREAFLRKWVPTDITYASFIGAMHLGCLLAPFTFTWSAFNCFLVMYFITGCLGITLSYHRQLSHKSFNTPKWLEYLLAYCGAMAVQGDPLEWRRATGTTTSTDTPKDPHTPYEGFWWSHCGWLLDNEATLKRVGDRSNAQEIAAQPFYRWLEIFDDAHVVAWAAAFYALGGLTLARVGLLRAHVLGVPHHVGGELRGARLGEPDVQHPGDLSRNNWWIGILAFGEGWHNNHHAFEFSARHGLEWPADRHDLDVRLRAEILRAGGQGEAPQAGAAGQDADQARGGRASAGVPREEARGAGAFFEVPEPHGREGRERPRETKQNRRVVL